MLEVLAYLIATIIPSTPLLPNPPGTIIPSIPFKELFTFLSVKGSELIHLSSTLAPFSYPANLILSMTEA
jgi:hypothetical protein